MKAARFAYHAARTLAEAVELLGRWAPEGGRILAGGQSLMPMMALRLAQPSHLIDINTIPGIDRASFDGATLRIPACARHAAFERNPLPGPLGAMLAHVAGHIAHHPIRTRGTFCGSLAHADPASEWCLAAVALEATIVARGTRAERVLPADVFFRGAMSTALDDDEMLTEVRIAAPPADARYGFAEHSRRAGDYALAMTLTRLRVQDGRIVAPRLAVGGAERSPRRLREVEALLEGAACAPATAARAAEAAADSIDAMEDVQVCASLRRDMVRATTRRALLRAFA